MLINALHSELAVYPPPATLTATTSTTTTSTTFGELLSPLMSECLSDCLRRRMTPARYSAGASAGHGNNSCTDSEASEMSALNLSVPPGKQPNDHCT